MTLVTWLMLGLGAFLIYAAVKGNNPLNVVAQRFNFPTKAPAKLGVVR